MLQSRRAFLRASLTSAAGLLAACTTPPVDPAVIPSPTAAPTILVEQEPPTVNVLAEGLDFPEGPAFDPQGNLWCTEMGKGNLVQIVEGVLKRIPTGGRPNSLAFDRQGRAWICDSRQNAIRRYDPAAEAWQTLLDAIDGQPLHTPNDLAFDALGNLVFTCPNYEDTQPTGYVACLRPDGSAVRLVEGWNRPNGLDFIDGGARLVVADTLRKTLYMAPWDAERALWDDPKPWVEVGGAEGPDGMCPGADGLLYQAIYGDGVLRVIDTQAARVVREIALPGLNPTNAAVDPSGRLGLVVTEAERGRLLSLPEIQPGEAIFDGGEAWP